MNNKLTLILAVSAILLSLADQAMAVPPRHMPDAGSSSVLLGLAFGGVAMARMLISKRK